MFKSLRLIFLAVLFFVGYFFWSWIESQLNAYIPGFPTGYTFWLFGLIPIWISGATILLGLAIVFGLLGIMLLIVGV